MVFKGQISYPWFEEDNYNILTIFNPLKVDTNIVGSVSNGLIFCNSLEWIKVWWSSPWFVSWDRVLVSTILLSFKLGSEFEWMLSLQWKFLHRFHDNSFVGRSTIFLKVERQQRESVPLCLVMNKVIIDLIVFHMSMEHRIVRQVNNTFIIK